MTPEQELLSALAKTAFRLNGQFLAIGEELARPAGLTAAWWLVLGTVLETPHTVAEVAREVGVTRQSVQRIADILVERQLAVYRPNPAHRRAKLLSPTADGRSAIHRIGPAHAAFADRLAEAAGIEQLRRVLDAVADLSDTRDDIGGARAEHAAAG